MLFHFQNKETEKFFELIENNLKIVHPRFQAVFKTFLKDKEKIINTLQLPYSIDKLEATNHLIKFIIAKLKKKLNNLMHPRGVEPLTAWFVVRYSIQLS